MTIKRLPSIETVLFMTKIIMSNSTEYILFTQLDNSQDDTIYRFLPTLNNLVEINELKKDLSVIFEAMRGREFNLYTHNPYTHDEMKKFYESKKNSVVVKYYGDLDYIAQRNDFLRHKIIPKLISKILSNIEGHFITENRVPPFAIAQYDGGLFIQMDGNEDDIKTFIKDAKQYGYHVNITKRINSMGSHSNNYAVNCLGSNIGSLEADQLHVITGRFNYKKMVDEAWNENYSKLVYAFLKGGQFFENLYVDTCKD